jgi:hypothetical protein
MPTHCSHPSIGASGRRTITRFGCASAMTRQGMSAVARQHSLVFIAVLLGALLVAAPSPVVNETSGPQGCPKAAIGAIHVNKDGITVGGDNFTDAAHNGILTARFSLEHSWGQAVVVLNLNTMEAHATRGSVRIYRGVFCAFPDR